MAPMDWLPAPDDARFFALAIALPVCVVACIAVATWAGLRGWATYRKARVAEALLQVHVDAASARADIAARRTVKLGDRSESLQSSVGEMQTSIKELQYLVALVPQERERMQRRLLDLVLPAMLREKQ